MRRAVVDPQSPLREQHVTMLFALLSELTWMPLVASHRSAFTDPSLQQWSLRSPEVQEQKMTTPRRALILVDVQQEYFGGPLEIRYPAHTESLPRILAAIDAATAANVPIAAIQHSGGETAPVFNPTTDGFSLHPEVERRRDESWKSVTKRYGTIFAETDILEWLRARNIDTITLVGYMTNNCIIASAAESETHGLAAEVLSDATGSISIANGAGFADAQTVHETFMTVLNSNFAAVATTAEWVSAVSDGAELARGDLGSSAVTGAQRAAQ
jgi:nicotinamidase-related amidase